MRRPCAWCGHSSAPRWPSPCSTGSSSPWRERWRCSGSRLALAPLASSSSARGPEVAGLGRSREMLVVPGMVRGRLKGLPRGARLSPSLMQVVRAHPPKETPRLRPCSRPADAQLLVVALEDRALAIDSTCWPPAAIFAHSPSSASEGPRGWTQRAPRARPFSAARVPGPLTRIAILVVSIAFIAVRVRQPALYLFPVDLLRRGALGRPPSSAGVLAMIFTFVLPLALMTTLPSPSRCWEKLTPGTAVARSRRHPALQPAWPAPSWLASIRPLTPSASS